MLTLSYHAAKTDLMLREKLNGLLSKKNELEAKIKSLADNPVTQQEYTDALQKVNDLIGLIRYHSLDNLNVLAKESGEKIEKSKVYVQAGQPVPKNATVEVGPKGGHFYIADPNEPRHKTLRGAPISPSWRDVHIAVDPKNPIQAWGRDEAGRQVYKKTVESAKKSDVIKFQRLKKFSKDLPKIMKRIDADFDKSEEARVLYLLSKTAFRIGSNNDTKAKVKAYGASTLECQHIKVDGDAISFDFIGKKGVRIQKIIKDSKLASLFGKRCKKDSQPLFNTDRDRVLEYLRGAANYPYKNHDFRTYLANSIAYEEIKRIPAPESKAQFKQLRKQVAEKVSQFLHNTPTMALNSYIAPEVFSKWQVAVESFSKQEMSFDEYLNTIYYDQEIPDDESIIPDDDEDDDNNNYGEEETDRLPNHIELRKALDDINFSDWSSLDFLKLQQDVFSELQTDPSRSLIDIVKSKVDPHVHDGVCIMLKVPEDIAEKMALDGGEPKDKLHCTLVYFGDDSKFDAGKLSEIDSIVQEVAKNNRAINCKLSGMARFDGKEDLDPMVALVNSQDLLDFREKLCLQLNEAGFSWTQDYAYTPHVTLKYLGKTDDTPNIETLPEYAVFSQLMLLEGGDNKKAYEIGSGEAIEKASITPGSFSTEQQTSPELENQVTKPIKVNGVKEQTEKTPLDNKEPYIEKGGFDPNSDTLYDDIDKMLEE